MHQSYSNFVGKKRERERERHTHIWMDGWITVTTSYYIIQYDVYREDDVGRHGLGRATVLYYGLLMMLCCLENAGGGEC